MRTPVYDAPGRFERVLFRLLKEVFREVIRQVNNVSENHFLPNLLIAVIATPIRL